MGMPAFSMFSAQQSPIAIDFGSTAVKLLQIVPAETPAVVGAVGLRIPDELRADADARMKFFENQLPRMLRKGNFKGRRVICSIPASETVVQHMQISALDGVDKDETVKMELASQRQIPPSGMVVQSQFVTEINRSGETLAEMICFASNRETVMRYVELLRKCKLETVGAHSEIIGMVRAFDHLQPPPDQPSVTTMYVDIGWATTKVAITHDAQIVFARCVALGGRQIDEQLAKRLGCDPPTARAQRISEQVLATAGGGKSTGGGGTAVAADGAPEPEVAELGSALADELSMCVRYHHSIFRGKSIDRLIFLGGEARNIELCQGIARDLHLPAQLGDPLSRFSCKRSLRTPGLTLGQPQPGWAVACGLCTAPTDL